MRVCIHHLETKGVLKYKFTTKFRNEKLWHVDLTKPREPEPHVIKDYIEKNKVEDYGAYIKYNEEDNLGKK